MKNTVIITGASGGIGSAIARKFAENGWDIALMYLSSQSEAEVLKSELESSGSKIYCRKCDISDVNQVNDFVRETEENLGEITALINNAGVSLQKLFCDVTDEEAQKIFDVNVKGVFNATKAVLPAMIRRKSGKIVNISSMWGICGASCEVHYSASKAAVIGFTKALAKEVGPSSINVNCVAPGLINTKMNAHLDEDVVKMFVEEIPLMKMGRSRDVAEMVFFLCSDASDYITGQTFSVDGGIVI